MRAIFKAILAALMAIPVLVFEAGRWVFRLVSMPQMPAGGNAASAVADEILEAQEEARLLREVPPQPALAATLVWRQAAYLVGKGGRTLTGDEWEKIPDQLALWLRRLTPWQMREVAAHTPHEIEQHWRSRKPEDRIERVPMVPSQSTTSAELERMKAAVQKAREAHEAKLAEEAHRREATVSMLNDMLDPEAA